MTKDEVEFTVTLKLDPDGLSYKYTVTYKSDEISKYFKALIWDEFGLDLDKE